MAASWLVSFGDARADAPLLFPPAQEVIRLPRPIPEDESANVGTMVPVSQPELEHALDPIMISIDVDEAPTTKDSAIKWKRSFEFGAAGAQGRTNSFTMRAGLDAERATPTVTHTLKIKHVDSSGTGLDSVQNTLADGRVEWPFMESPWTYFIRSSSERDVLRDYNVRVAGSSGFGYEFFKVADHTLICRFGGSFSRAFGGQTDHFVPEASLGMEWSRQLTTRHTIKANAECVPALERPLNYRLNTDAAWEVLMDPDAGLKLKLAVSDRYDRSQEPAVRGNLNYSALLLWPF